jgi:nucleoside-diphosphate-sugar epimerase
MNRYFITGSSGFIGTNLVEELRLRSEYVYGYDAKRPRILAHADYFTAGSLLDKEQLRAALLSFAPTHIIHMGARTDLDGKVISDYRENTEGVSNLIDCCDSLPTLKRVIFASSRLVCEIGYIPTSYDDYSPTTAYGESKVQGEIIVKSLSPRKWDWCIVRPTSIWGEWFGVPYRNFFDLIKSEKYFHPAGLQVKKSFGYVGNVVYEVLALAQADAEKVAGKCFYVGDYEEIEVGAFASEIARRFGVKRPVEVPQSLLRFAARFGDFLDNFGVKFPLTTFRLNNLITPMPHNFEDLKQVVGKLPYDLDIGIERTVKWMRGNATN